VPRPPCPNCGERGIAVGIQPAVEIDIAMPIEVALSPRYQGWGWQQRWEGAQEDIERVVARHPEELSRQAINAAYRDLLSFYVRTYHIKDPLKEEEVSLGLKPGTVEDAISNDRDLALLADLANLSKHVDLSRYGARSGVEPKIVSTQGVRSGSGEDGWRLKVMIDHGGNVLDGLDLAQAAVEAWRRHLKGWGLIP
jgi:hypothetical protein